MQETQLQIHPKPENEEIALNQSTSGALEEAKEKLRLSLEQNSSNEASDESQPPYQDLPSYCSVEQDVAENLVGLNVFLT